MVLGFRRRWVAPILSGEKTITFRSAKSRLPRVGAVVALRCEYHLPPFAHARVVEVRGVRRADVTLEDVRADGWTSRAQWSEAIADHYAGQRLVLVRFVVVDR